MRVKSVSILFFVYGICLAFSLRANPPCGNHILQQHAGNPAYWLSLENINEQLLQQARLFDTDPDSFLTIPVVFHILHTGESIGSGSNISEARVLANLLTTNRAWNDSADRGANMAVQFCLAQTDPNGNPTNGIVRIDASSVPQYSSLGIGYAGDPGASESALKQLSNWPHDRYYNIWVVNKIAGGWAGFAYYPTGSNFNDDGTVIAASSVKAGNEVLAHEVGHGLGLYHTFQGGDEECPSNDNCATQGDRVCDTPPHKIYDCVFSPCSSGDLTNSTWNIMSYCSLTRQLFTEGQKTRSRNAIFTTTRADLLSSPVCNYICTPVVTDLNAKTCSLDSVGVISDTLTAGHGCDSIIQTTFTLLAAPLAGFSYAFTTSLQADFQLLSAMDAGTTIHWDFGDGGVSIESNPTHTYAGGGTYEVVLTLNNSCGADSQKQMLTILPTGIKQPGSNSFKVYPNPSDGSFMLELNRAAKDNMRLRFLNVFGQTIEEQILPAGKVHSIQLKDIFPDGLYFLQIMDDSGLIGTGQLLLKY